MPDGNHMIPALAVAMLTVLPDGCQLMASQIRFPTVPGASVNVCVDPVVARTDVTFLPRKGH